MTREEASNILDDYDVNFDGHTAEEIAEAFDVAFRALEQESVIDKIRAEIEKWHRDGTNWSDIRLMKIEDILDQYKTEIEPRKVR